MTLNIHQKIIMSSATVFFILALYDVLLHLLLQTLHILFESAEWFLDSIIELLFETGMRETEIIVFYILLTAFFYGLYRFYRLLPQGFAKVKKMLKSQQTECLLQWKAISLWSKILWLSFFITIFNIWLFLT